MSSLGLIEWCVWHPVVTEEIFMYVSINVTASLTLAFGIKFTLMLYFGDYAHLIYNGEEIIK